MKTLRILLVLAFLLPSVAGAADYEISVTRKGSNLYKVDGKDVYIRTGFCFEFAFSERVLLMMRGYRGEIVFLNSGNKYDVKGVYGRVSQTPGDYSVRVSSEEDDWYSVQGTSVYIRTDGCTSYVYGRRAVLSIQGSRGYGTLYIDGKQCAVEGVYTEISL